MSYGYIVGQELLSLNYFETRLRNAPGLEERKELETVIQNLQRAVEEKGADLKAVSEKSNYSLSFQGGLGR